jgi:hypothetical protein
MTHPPAGSQVEPARHGAHTEVTHSRGLSAVTCCAAPNRLAAAPGRKEIGKDRGMARVRHSDAHPLFSEPRHSRAENSFDQATRLPSPTARRSVLSNFALASMSSAE